MVSPAPSIDDSLATSWPDPVDPREMDRRLPGVMDGINIMAGAANVIMQLARPGVGYGVMESRVDSGNLFKRPLKRTRTTLTYLAVAILGTPDEKLAYRQAVNGAHAQVRSTAESPVRYNAFDPSLQLWVAACLFRGFVDAMGGFRGPLDDDQLEELYQRADALGTTLQVRPGMWPANIGAFHAYWEEGAAQIRIDDPVRAYLTDIAELKFLSPLLHVPFGRLHRFVTAGFLPPRFRAEMHFAWGPAQQRRFDRLVGAIGLVNRILPRLVRQAPFLLVLQDFRRRRRQGAPLV